MRCYPYCKHDIASHSILCYAFNMLHGAWRGRLGVWPTPGLLNRDPDKRLGSGPSGIEEVKKQKFFRSISWGAAEDRNLQPPIVRRTRTIPRPHCLDARGCGWGMGSEKCVGAQLN